MDNKLLLAKLITLVYMESLLPANGGNSTELVNEILRNMRAPEADSNANEATREIEASLRKTLTWMMNTPAGKAIERKTLLQQLQVISSRDEFLYESFNYTFGEHYDIPEAEIIAAEHRKFLNVYMRKYYVKKIMREDFFKLNSDDDKIDWRHFVREHAARMEPFLNIEEEGNHRAVVNRLSLTNEEEVTNLIIRAKDELSGEGVIRFGYQALNRMFGDPTGIRGAARRGEQAVIGALTHNGKSNMLIAMTRQHAQYNTPYMRNGDKTPLIVRMSGENNAPEDVLQIYKSAYEAETGKLVNIKDVNAAEASAYLKKKLGANGYEMEYIRVDPSDFTVFDLFDYIVTLERQGFEIHGFYHDMLPNHSKKGLTHGHAGYEFRDMYRRVRNFTNPRGIFYVTPHQLSPGARELIRDGKGDDQFVKLLPEGSYYDSCSTISQEVDIEIFQHIVKVNGASYLTVQRGKHRKIEITPDRDQYFVYKFSQIGGLVDDIMGHDMSMRRAGGSPMSEGGDDPWFTNY